MPSEAAFPGWELLVEGPPDAGGGVWVCAPLARSGRSDWVRVRGARGDGRKLLESGEGVT